MRKILFINKGDNIDYQCDCLFHGLQSLDDVYVEVINDNWFMYKGNSSEKLHKLYGKGFSITNRIPIEKKHVIDKEEAALKIKSHDYDYVIFGSIYRYNELYNEVISNYKRTEVAFIDGEDCDYTTTFSIKGLYHIPRDTKWKKQAKEIASHGVYFKRERTKQTKNMFLPISFAIPEENIVSNIPKKDIEQAYVYPDRKETYIYDNEPDYFKGYQEAKFGVTFKKAGWDCLRHYEILANGCIPYFPDILDCPEDTMVNFPKNIINETNQLRDAGKMSDSRYDYYVKWLLGYTKKYLTTKELAKYVLSCLD